MSSKSESGHGTNVVNFEKLIISCTNFGADYKPSRESLKIHSLQALHTEARSSIDNVSTLEPLLRKAIAARKIVFAPFVKLISRINNALKASDTPTQVDETAQSIIRKLLGRRSSAKLTEEEKLAAEAKGETVVEISASQMSFDSRVDNFDKLIKLLASIPEYAPNEADLKVEALTALYDEMKAKNLSVANADIALNNARTARNSVMYKTNTGLVDIAADVKTYIKSIYGQSSPQFKQVSGLKFVKYSM